MLPLSTEHIIWHLILFIESVISFQLFSLFFYFFIYAFIYFVQNILLEGENKIDIRLKMILSYCERKVDKDVSVLVLSIGNYNATIILSYLLLSSHKWRKQCNKRPGGFFSSVIICFFRRDKHLSRKLFQLYIHPYQLQHTTLYKWRDLLDWILWNIQSMEDL